MKLRSMLYVPAHSERFIAKAHERGADAIILDLEDAVPEADKDRARDGLAAAGKSVSRNGAKVFVRINSGERRQADAEAATKAGAAGLVLAKAELRELGGFSLPLVAMLESPGAVLDAREYAKHRGVMGLLVGSEDLATELGATPTPEVLRTPKLLVHYAAKAEGKLSFGLLRSVADYADLAAIEAAGREAREHGFDGATCVHPSVVPVLNTAFAPSVDEIAWAERVIGAAKSGAGAFTVDGRMVDAPVVARARRILEPLMPSLGFNPYVPRPIDRPTVVPLAPEADLSVLDEAKIFAAPDDPSDWPAWRAAITRWRKEARAKVTYDDARYRGKNPSARVMNVAWLWDELLYDQERGVFTVDRYLDAAERDFGGFDGVTLWNAYPVLGIDERNHFAYFEDVAELPDVVRQFRASGVRVYLSYYPWETGSGTEAIETVAGLVTKLGVDGVFLDTAKEASDALRAALDAIDPSLTLEGELKVPLGKVAAQTMSWAQWFADSTTPGVLRTKWLERRHELHHIRRWNRDHLDELHSSWLNGTGVLVWEVVFGVWVGWSARDKATLRAMSAVYRSHAEWFVSEDWTPLVETAAPQLVASKWVHEGVPLWTIVNRGGDYRGEWIAGEGLVDLVTGEPAAGQLLRAGGIAAVTLAQAVTPSSGLRPPSPIKGEWQGPRS